MAKLKDFDRITSFSNINKFEEIFVFGRLVFALLELVCFQVVVSKTQFIYKTSCSLANYAFYGSF